MKNMDGDMLTDDPRKRVPCPWDPGATCPEDSKQYVEFEDYGEFMIVTWKKNGKRGQRIIEHPGAIHLIRKQIFGAIPKERDILDWKEKKELMTQAQDLVEQLAIEIHVGPERMMINGLKLSMGAMVDFYTIQEEESN